MDEALILSQFDQLVKSGLVLYDDEQEIIEHTDGELKFAFCLTSSLAKKPTLAQNPAIEPSALQTNGNSGLADQRRDGSDISTVGFEIGDVSSTHFLVANKFCFARPHLMLLTSDGHKRQYESLNEDDLSATWSVLSTVSRDYVAFYNCGQDGGCSRLHKHLQLMPTPPNSFASFLDSSEENKSAVPFQWFHCCFDSQHMTTADLTKIYTDLLEQATEVGEGLSEHAATAVPEAVCPHNMILTKRWMVVLPRRRAAINKEAGVNALGMLGYIAVATQNEINNWIRLGLTDSLRELGVPR